jgi:hypothetical protein
MATIALKRPAGRIYEEDWEVDQRLKAFGVTRAELVAVARAVVAARADAVEDDPLPAAGQFAYIFGTRFTRALLRSKGWLLQREENIESVRHPDKDWRVVYQSVDLAATRSHIPQAISGKGAGADRFIDSAQGELFTESQLAGAKNLPAKIEPVNSGAWFFCVSVGGSDDDMVRAELMLPTAARYGNFDGYIERIFIIRRGEWPDLAVMPLPEGGAAEFEPVVTRK